MSRAFVKESDADVVEDVGELPLSPHPNYVTARGLRLLQARLAEITDDPATADLPMAQRRQRWLQSRIADAIPLEAPRTPDRVGFGAIVEIAEVASGATHRYQIVGEDEAEPEAGRVSWVSPLARALTGTRPGDVVTWRRPAGDVDVEVLSIAYE